MLQVVIETCDNSLSTWFVNCFTIINMVIGKFSFKGNSRFLQKQVKLYKKYGATPKKYSCLIKREMHKKRGFCKNEICLDC